MATQFVIGQAVRVKMVIPQGPVQAFKMEPDGTILCLISWTDENGASQSRWFPESQLEAA